MFRKLLSLRTSQSSSGYIKSIVAKELKLSVTTSQTLSFNVRFVLIPAKCVVLRFDLSTSMYEVKNWRHSGTLFIRLKLKLSGTTSQTVLSNVRSVLIPAKCVVLRFDLSTSKYEVKNLRHLGTLFIQLYICKGTKIF